MSPLGLVALWALSTSPVLAQEINLRNANFHLQQDDVTVQRPGTSLELVRTYNSRSNEVGLFGYGWSTPFDTAVKLHADGSLMVVDEDGFMLSYTLVGKSPAEVREKFVDRLIAAQRNDDRAHGTEGDDAHYETLRKEWLDRPTERERASYRFQKAWVEPVDGEYKSFDRGTEIITKRGDVYTRTRANGLIETYNLQGRLISREDTAGHGLRVDYDRGGRLLKVAHTDGGQLSFTYDAQGRVASVLDTENRNISFAYDAEDNLLRVKGPAKRSVAYAYDDEHNLVAVTNADNTGHQIQYDKEKDWAVALKRGEEITRYSWQVLDADTNHFVCNVIEPSGKRTRHEFNDKDHVSVETDTSGGVTRTVYSSCCNKPLEVTTPDGKVTRYDYDPDARLTGVTRPDGTTARYTYHPQHNRIVQAAFSDGRRYGYAYDAGGRITTVESSDGTKLTLEYGPNGKVARILSGDSSNYAFEYDADGRPVRITGRKGATLALSYGVTGELVGSQISTDTDAAKQAFYNDLRKVLSMLEPASGEI